MHTQLLENPHDEATWDQFCALSTAEREAVIDDLKAELDKLVRSSPPRALAVAELLFRAAEATPSRLAVGYRGRAVAQHVNDQTDAALADYLRAIELYRQAGAELEVARLERALIDLHHLAGRSNAAFACAERAQRTFERLGEERQLAQLEVNLGNVYFRQDELPEAGRAYAAAAERFRRLGDETGVGIAEFNRGNVEVFAGRYRHADEAYSAAAEVFERNEQWVHVAECGYAQAWMLSMRCRFAEAIPALEAARARFEEVGRPSRTPLCDLDLAELYLRLDARWDAIEAATRAAAAFAQLGLDYELAKALSVRGFSMGRTGDPNAAFEDLDRAAALFEQLGNERQARALMIQRFGAAIAAGRVDADQVDQLSSTHALLAGGSNALLLGISTLLLARALTALGRPAEAIELLRPMTESTTERAAPDILLEADGLRALAEAHHRAGDLEATIEALERAVDCIESTRARVPGSDARMAFFRDRHGAYVTLARLLAQRSDAAAGLEQLERGRSSEARLRRALPLETDIEAEREQLDSLLLRRLDADLGGLTGNAEADSSGPADEALIKAETRLVRKLRERGLAAQATQAADPIDCLQPGERALSFLSDEVGLGVFVSSSEGTEWVALDAELDAVQQLAERLELAMKKRLAGATSPAREARALAKIEAALAGLGALLLEPLAPYLEDATRLILIPYGSLHGLPFHALYLDGKALIERFEVSLAPSLAALARCRAPRSKRPGAARLLVAARDEQLPAIAREAEQLLELHAGALVELPAKQLLGTLATESNAGGCLHIAAHGAFQPHNPLFSGLALESTVLTAHDVRSLDLDLELVTLGGCETGRSGHIEGEALIGIDQAFLAAGARAVVSSLWVVDDQTAARQMQALHRELLAGASVGAALAQVQRADRARSAHPFDWAPFVLVGDPGARLSPRP